jgi:hypothetical protein
MRLTFKSFDSKMASREKLFKAAIEFANKVDRKDLINITHSEDHDNIVITIWYYTDEVDRGAELKAKLAADKKDSGILRSGVQIGPAGRPTAQGIAPAGRPTARGIPPSVAPPEAAPAAPESVAPPESASPSPTPPDEEPTPSPPPLLRRKNRAPSQEEQVHRPSPDTHIRMPAREPPPDSGEPMDI